MLALIPIRNQAHRIQPLFRYLEKGLINHISSFVFIDESSNDRSLDVLKLEIDKLHKPYTLLKSEAKDRANSLAISFSIAQDKNESRIICFHEGWEDSIEEIHHIIASHEYKNYTIISGVRNPKRKNLGSLFNDLINCLYSLKYRINIPDCKGDSINIYDISRLNTSFLGNEQVHHQKLLNRALKQEKNVLFTIVDNGLNSSSYLKLNTLWFLKSFYLYFFK